MERALLSVYDKSGLVDFAEALLDNGVELIASGGTGAAIQDAGLALRTIEDITGLPSILGGRVKTLHPAVHSGILARLGGDDQAVLNEQGWPLIDLVVVNLYPFIETISQPDVTEEEAIEQIDIGGVAMIRAAAKNHERVTVITGPEDYHIVLDELASYGDMRSETRRALAQKAFALTAAYDAAIAGFFAHQDDELPTSLSVSMPASAALRYGENPHQQARLYGPSTIHPLGGELLQGKALSYNNLLDIDAAWTAVEDFELPTVVIVKHLSPTGIASGDYLPDVYQDALASDPVSAFGGVMAVNQQVDEELVESIGKVFVEAIAAPEFTEAAIEMLHERKKNCRLLKMGPVEPAYFRVRSVRGGLLAQTPDRTVDTDWQIVTERQPSNEEMAGLRFAWRVVKHVKSNAIVLTRGQRTVGIGGGLPSRVDATQLAVMKAGERAQGASLASDAFFPFADGPEAAAAAGVTAIVQPGGSIRDQDVIDACNRLDIAMCFTGVRHFRH
ncbi:MAG: bifunctional phosphoribosylaminoimidazolecarboxamide formyltransferase/IMP cyclohydrolase [Chloroflexi bacterium]|nr:bifunctional phosphoribosylaminoimidazolecarboxamide formyltransferase/IMP cyclohydrolase [Chloroflexota bacterium]